MISAADGRGTRSFPTLKGKAKVEIGASPPPPPRPPPRPWREQLRRDPLAFYTVQAAQPYGIRKSRADVGRKVRSSKRLFTWAFSFGPRGAPHVVELRVSVVSGKRVISVDGAVVYEASSMKPGFAHAFHMEGAHLARVAATKSVEESFELSVDAVPFESMPDRQSVSDAQADREDAKARDTARRMAEDAAARPPQPPTREDLACLVQEFAFKAPRSDANDARKFLERHDWDPDAAVAAYRRMRDATPESILAAQPSGPELRVGERNAAPERAAPAAPPPPPEADLLSFSPTQTPRSSPAPAPEPPSFQQPANPFDLFDQMAAQQYQQQQPVAPPPVAPQPVAPQPVAPAAPPADMWAVAPPPLRSAPPAAMAPPPLAMAPPPLAPQQPPVAPQQPPPPPAAAAPPANPFAAFEAIPQG